jgi:hypothetical protein
MKRILSIAVVTVAIIAVITSVIVPHHHHGDAVCIATHHCDHDCGDDGHSCDGNSSDCSRHHHAADNCPFDNNGCIAKATYVVSDRIEVKCNVRSLDVHNNNNDYFVPVFTLFANPYDTEAKFAHLSKLRYKEKPIFRETGNVNRINGLRAPPYSVVR